MATVFKTPDEVAEEFLLHAKGLRSDIDTAQEDSDWWIRSRAIGGVGAGIYSDQRKIGDDAFPQSARRDAVKKHLYRVFGETDFRPAAKATGKLLVTGLAHAVVHIGDEWTYEANGNAYQATDTLDLGTATSGLVDVESVNTGQAQNLIEGAEVRASSPPPGIDAVATVYEDMQDGKNEETPQEAAARILAREQSSARGGNDTDHILWAFAAHPSVSSARVLRFAAGYATVGLVIAAGTTDIDAALDNGDAVSLIPSEEVVEAVQDYIDDGLRPTTEMMLAVAVTTTPVDVTVKVKFKTGTKDTVLAGQTLTQGEIVEREINRAIYKSGAGGRVVDTDSTQGYVLNEDIEQMIDSRLSAGPEVLGSTLQIVTNRDVENLDGVNLDIAIAGTAHPIPGTITIEDM
jgi:uncharacterized phage protein gp47/JayE